MRQVELNDDNLNKQGDLDVDEILTELQGSSLWQWTNFFLLCLPSMASGFLVLSFSFTGTSSYFSIIFKLVMKILKLRIKSTTISINVCTHHFRLQA